MTVVGDDDGYDELYCLKHLKLAQRPFCKRFKSAAGLSEARSGDSESRNLSVTFESLPENFDLLEIRLPFYFFDCWCKPRFLRLSSRDAGRSGSWHVPWVFSEELSLLVDKPRTSFDSVVIGITDSRLPRRSCILQHIESRQKSLF